MDGASERKKQMAREMEEKKRRLLMHSWKRKPGSHFPDTQQMEEEIQQELRQQSEDAKATMKPWATYENRHEELRSSL